MRHRLTEPAAEPDLAARVDGRPSAGNQGRLWAGLVDPPVPPPDPFASPALRAAGDGRVAFDVAECAGELRPQGLFEESLALAVQDPDALGYGPLGTPLPGLEAAARGYLTARGVTTERSATLVTSGTTSSLAILARALAPAGGTVVVEHPTWHVALAVFAAAGLRVTGIPVDEEGLRLDLLVPALRQRRPCMIYLQPAFQNPTGVTLSAERRADLVRLARRAGAVVVEDDFAAELAFDEIPPPLRTGERCDDVVYLKSFSKLLMPALRVALMVAPSRYERALREVQHGFDPFPSALAQAVLGRCLRTPEFRQHTRRVAAHLDARWQALDGALQTRMPESVRWTSPRGGLCAWLEVPAPLTALELLVDAAERGVGICPGSAFCLDDSGSRGVRLAFGATPPSAIDRGVRRLAAAVRDRLRDRGRSPRVGANAAP